MKLIVCLITLSLILAPWSSVFVDAETEEDQEVGSVWDAWVMWAEWLETPRSHRSWRKLRIRLRQLRRRMRYLFHRFEHHYQGVRQWLLDTLWIRPGLEKVPSLPEISGEHLPSSMPTEQTIMSSTSQDVSSSTSAIPEAEEHPKPTKRGRGCPRKIPTNHRCCPNNECSSWGIFGPHPDHDITGNGTYKTKHGEVRQMYLCKVCKKPFSETAGTPFYQLKTPKETVVHTLNDVAEGLGVRAAARTNHVDKDTVQRWVKRAGRHSQRLAEYMMQGFELAQAQMDELWTFVRKKQRQLSDWEKENTAFGDNWIWIVFDPVHKMISAVVIGERTEEEAKSLLRILKDRLAEGVLPLFTSDSLAHYMQAILQVFGKWIQPKRKGKRGPLPKSRPVAQEGLHYATVHKEREKGRVISVTTRVVYGKMKKVLARLEALGQTINTSYVERVNLTLRLLVSRLHRKTLCFSKEQDYLEYHLHLALAYYHFVLYHSSLRQRLPEPIPTRGNGSPKIWKKRTPAMSAGLTDHKWSMEELLLFQVPAVP